VENLKGVLFFPTWQICPTPRFSWVGIRLSGSYQHYDHLRSSCQWLLKHPPICSVWCNAGRESGGVLGPWWVVKQEKNTLHNLKGLRVEIVSPYRVILIVKRNMWQVPVTDKNSVLLWSRWEVLTLQSVLQPWPLPIKSYLYIVTLLSLPTLSFKNFSRSWYVCSIKLFYGTPYRLWHKCLHHQKGYLLTVCRIHWILPLKCHWALYQPLCREAHVHMRQSTCSASQHVLGQNLTICSQLALSNLQLASSTPP